ncbi:MAG: hypothetical protein HY006_02790 [Candidatus Sungbacteria bacterium]|nr:hypothetical protein [Candidatus Sungbacteria bacterium]
MPQSPDGLKHTTKRLWAFFFILVLAFLAWWLLTGGPLSSRLERIIMVSRTSSQVTLPAGGTLRQVFRTNGGTYSGTIVLANSSTLAGRRMQVRMLDHEGRELSRSYGVSTSYLPADETLRLEFALHRFTVQPRQEITEEISLLSGSPLAVRATQLHSGIYPEVHLHINGEGLDQQVALALVKPAVLPFAETMGVAAGLLFTIGLAALIIFLPKRWQWLGIGALFVVITPVALYGFWFSENSLGIADWDYYFSLHHFYRETILTYHQLPLWDPWTCGGGAALGDPEFPLFSVTFLLELLFGIQVGLRLSIYASVVGTALGMLALCRRFRFSPVAAAVTSLAAAFGSVSLLEIVEGHVNVLSAMWIPWIFWAWYAAYQASSKYEVVSSKQFFLHKYVVLCALFLALMFYAGGVYLLMYTGLAFLFLLLAVPNRTQALAVTVASGGLALGLAAFKLVPVILWLRQFPDEAYASSAVTLANWYDILLGRYLHNSYVIFRQDSGWHEYGAYIGPFVFALAILGLSQMRRRSVAILAGGGALAWLLSMSGPSLKPLFDILWFFPRSNISRIILMAVLPLCLLAGIGFDTARRKLKLPPFFLALIVGLVAVDVMSLASQLSRQPFVLPHVYPLISPAPAPLAITSQRYDDQGSGARHTRTYDAAAQGYGATAYCSVLGPNPAPRLISDPGGDIYVIAQDSRARVDLLSWTPNKLTVRVDTPAETKIGVNTNYVKGWYVNRQPVIEMDNRVAALVPAGVGVYTFEYKAPGFFTGMAIFFVTLIMVAFGRLFGVLLQAWKRWSA